MLRCSIGCVRHDKDQFDVPYRYLRHHTCLANTEYDLYFMNTICGKLARCESEWRNHDFGPAINSNPESTGTISITTLASRIAHTCRAHRATSSPCPIRHASSASARRWSAPVAAPAVPDGSLFVPTPALVDTRCR